MNQCYWPNLQMSQLLENNYITSFWLNHDYANFGEMRQYLTCHIFYTRVKYAAVETKSWFSTIQKNERLKL